MSCPIDLPDLNVWLALTTPDHVHHKRAVRYWEQDAAEQILFCTVTALGLLRLVMQPKVMGAAVRTVTGASELLQSLLAQPGVEMAQPKDDGWAIFHQLMQNKNLPPRLCTDAHLAALAISNNWRLVSFDQDFRRFRQLNWLPLTVQ